MTWFTMNERYTDYLRDESRHTGQCKEVCFPKSTQELQQALLECVRTGTPVTVQGARTGITGAGVPRCGRLISTERLTGCLLQGGRLEAQCGVRLQDIQAAARPSGQVFAPNPTEDTASLGGLFACAASGPNCAEYGDVASHVLGTAVLLADGRRWELERGRYCFDRSGCSLPGGGRLELHTPLPPKGAPRWGFAPQVGMDLLDLFSGSEGVLALLTDFQLKLSPRPTQAWGLLFFFEDRAASLGFAASLSKMAPPQAALTALEFFDGATLSLISALRQTASRLQGLPPFPAHRSGAVYAQLEFFSSSPPQQALMDCLARFAQWGGKEPDTWAVSGSAELERLHLLRHAAAESVNVRLDLCRRTLPGLTKLSGAFQTPLARMAEAAERYRADMDRAGVPGAVFGHASLSRLHVNLLPETQEQLRRAQDLLNEWAAWITGWGGHALAENGAGKTRLGFLERWAPPEQRALMAEVKRFFDPAGLLGPGTLLAIESHP